MSIVGAFVVGVEIPVL